MNLSKVPTMIVGDSGPRAAVTAEGLAETYIGGPDMVKPICSVSGCDRPVRARGWCGAHYMRWRRNGDPGTDVRTRRREVGLTNEERFWQRVEKQSNGCWVWTGGKNQKGYGTMYTSKTVKAHRFAYELIVGPIPEGLQLDHLCRNPACVNPDHLEPVTNQENTLRGFRARGQCRNGHSREHSYKARGGNLRCRVCDRATKLRSRARAGS
jgi:hypothetical protein